MAQKPISDEQITKALGAFSVGADWNLAAALIGTSREGLIRHVNKRPALKAAFREARDKTDERVVKRLFDKAIDGDTTAMIFWLKNRQPETWRDRREIAGDPKAPLMQSILVVTFGDDE